LLERRFAEAENLATKMYDLGRERGNPRLVFYGAYRLSSLETFRKNYEKAKEWIDIAEDWAKETHSERTSSIILYRRAAIAMSVGDFVAAEKYLLDALALNVTRGERRFVAQDKYWLARVYRDMGNVHLSRQYAEEALDSFERLGMKTYVQSVSTLLQEIENIEQ
jgi:tetratricopeptide (TPR) repeat protein